MFNLKDFISEELKIKKKNWDRAKDILLSLSAMIKEGFKIKKESYEESYDSFTQYFSTNDKLEDGFYLEYRTEDSNLKLGVVVPSKDVEILQSQIGEELKVFRNGERAFLSIEISEINPKILKGLIRILEYLNFRLN